MTGASGDRIERNTQAMLAEITSIYEIHRWARYSMWSGLLIMALFLTWLSGSIPPLAWRQLPGTIQQLSQVWTVTHNPSVLFSLLGLALVSLGWLLAWCLLLSATFGLLVYHWRWQQREREMAEQLLHLSQQPRQTFQFLCPGLFSISPSPRLTSTMTTRPRSRLARSLEVGVGWHVGKVRRASANEDSLLVLQGIATCKDRLMPFGLLIVADGMGGHSYGREASHIAIQTVTHAVMQDIISGDATEQPDDEWFIMVLTRGIEQANQAICAFSEEVEKGKETEMGTTITAALVLDAKAYVVNVGDSRTYLYSEEEGLSQITKDHSLVARLVETEQIEPDDVYTHPQRHQIYRSVGNSGGIDVDWFIANMRIGDRLLLCSDGLWEMVRDPAIEQIVGSKANVTVVSERLVRTALDSGGADNISVVVAEVV